MCPCARTRVRRVGLQKLSSHVPRVTGRVCVCVPSHSRIYKYEFELCAGNLRLASGDDHALSCTSVCIGALYAYTSIFFIVLSRIESVLVHTRARASSGPCRKSRLIHARGIRRRRDGTPPSATFTLSRRARVCVSPTRARARNVRRGNRTREDLCAERARDNATTSSSASDGSTSSEPFSRGPLLYVFMYVQ